MKNRYFIKKSIVGLLPLSLSMVVLFGLGKNKTNEVAAYSSSSLPTTIDLNDNTENEIRNYYANLSSLSSSEKQGSNLLKNLKGILKNGQKYYNYDTGSDVWKIYEIADRDWEKSPASAITGTIYGSYNSATNKITNYKYGTSVNSNKGSNPYVHAYYVDRSVDNPMTAWGSHDQKYGGINREHLWAKANGFDASGEAGARGDPMHLVPADGLTNNLHSAYTFGYVDKTKSFNIPSPSYAKNNYLGTSKTLGSGTVFEPQDSDKGDIARALFYMAARYNALDGDDSIDQNNPNLILGDYTWKGSGAYTSTKTNPGKYGILTDLLEWNRIDPPDEYEIHRNNLLFNNFTNNRNPFVDFPYWAEIAFGDSTKVANPQYDEINSVRPNADVVAITVTQQPTTTKYYEGEIFDPTGMVVKATYSDGSMGVVKDYTYSPTGSLSSTNSFINISYEGKETKISIQVDQSKKVIGLELVSNPQKLNYIEGEIFDPTGLTVNVLYNDNTKKTITNYGYFNGPLDVGTTSILITYGDFSEKYFGITVESKKASEKTIQLIMAELGFEDKQNVSIIETEDDFRIHFFMGSNTNNNSPLYSENNEAITIYSGNNFTISGRYKITKIALILDSSSSRNNDFTTDKNGYNNVTFEWSGKADDVTFTLNGKSGTSRIYGISISYDPNEEAEINEFTILDWVKEHWYIVAIVAGVIILVVIISVATKSKKKGKKHGKR